jgi:hypothetical protein
MLLPTASRSDCLNITRTKGEIGVGQSRDAAADQEATAFARASVGPG